VTEAGAKRHSEPSENTHPTGILNPGAIDAVTVGDDGVVELNVQQTAPWDGSDHLLLLTQEKLWNYLAYIADGELERVYPGATSWRVALLAREEPDRRTIELLRRADGEFRRLGGALVTRLTPSDR
jgi:hypothetical protein